METAISRQDQHCLLAGTRGQRSRRVVNRGIGVFEDIELLHVGIMIRNIPTGALNRPSVGHMSRDPKESGIGKLKVPCT
jgi:hypothetical protein